MIPLILHNEGDTCRISKVSGIDSMRKHLSDLGFVKNVEVTIISKVSNNLILNVKGSKIALDSNIASHIFS